MTTQEAAESETPPAGRSVISRGLCAAAARGRLELQSCAHCGAWQYPPRENCRMCLSDQFVWKQHSGKGELVSQTTLHHSHHPFFQRRLPWRIGLIRLDGGVNVLAHISSQLQSAPAAVSLSALLDSAGHVALFAEPAGEPSNKDDPQRAAITPQHF